MLPAVMDLSILATAIPHITDHFHSLDDIGWYATAYFLTVAATQSMWGKAYQFFNLKKGYLLSLFIFAIGSLISGVAPNSITVIIGRAITGVGAAGIFGGCFTVMAFSVKPQRRPAFAGILSASFGIGTSIGPIIGGVLADQLSWRWWQVTSATHHYLRSDTLQYSFYINLPLIGAAGIMIFFAFKTPPFAQHNDDAQASFAEKIRQMDPVGAGLIIAGMACFCLALQWGGITKAWSSADVIGTLVGFGLIVIVFCLWEYSQGSRAMLVPHILKKRPVSVGSIVIFLLGGAEYTMIYYIPIYFQSILGTSAEGSGVRNLPWVLSKSIVTLVFGFIISKTGHFTPYIIIGSVLSTVGAGLLSTLSLSSTTGDWIGYQILAGFGMGLSVRTPITANQALSNHRDLPATTAMLIFMQTFGGAVFNSVAQSTFTNTIERNLKAKVPKLVPSDVINAGATALRSFPAEDLDGLISSYDKGLQGVFYLVAAIAGVATIASLAMPWTSVKPKKAIKHRAPEA
ncbi:MFS gliotoxin efflux transporter [Lachnellula willkommii]|uniref:MFS gliotoxin efflux transporter n=1 Tax=Lachnellula willkommii TaxID=215461 RepID=A0A559MAE0_9HELO|nr:MFS gliotoxin efflux transporter [Lachnellula willkommii]